MTREAPIRIRYRGHEYYDPSFYVTKEDAKIVQGRLVKAGGLAIIRKYPVSEFRCPYHTVDKTGRPEFVRGKAFYGVYIRGGYSGIPWRKK